MVRAVIVYGELGVGKTTTGEHLAERARRQGLRVMGVLSLRVFQDELIGYDAVDLDTGERVPFARLRGKEYGEGWKEYMSLIYRFNSDGLDWANQVLAEAAEVMDVRTVVFVDEFGRLEARGLGIYEGAMKVASSGEGTAVFLCRTNMVDRMKGLLGENSAVQTALAGEDEKAWQMVQRFIDGMI